MVSGVAFPVHVWTASTAGNGNSITFFCINMQFYVLCIYAHML